VPTLPASGYAVPTAPSVDPLPNAPGSGFDIRAPVEAFGGASARALGELSQDFERASANWEKVTDEFDRVTALDARTKADMAANEILYGNPLDSTSTGYFGLEGRAKLDARPHTINSLRTIYDDAGKGLSPTAKRIYDQTTRGHRLGIEANVALDSIKALQEFRKQADAGAIKLKEQNTDRLALTDDLGAWNQSVGEGVQQIQAAGERANKPPEVIEVEKNAFRAGRITEKASALMERNPAAALEFIDNNSRFYADPSMLAAIRGRAKDKLEERQVEELSAPGGRAQKGAALIPHTPSTDLLTGTGLSANQYQTFRTYLASRESASYAQPPNAGGYSGRYQMGRNEIRETAERLGVSVPSQQEFLNDPALQERFLENYTLDHHNKLMQQSQVYRNSAPQTKAAYLMGAHLGGVGGVVKYLESDGKIDPKDSNGTSVGNYIASMRQAMAGAGGGAPIGAPPGIADEYIRIKTSPFSLEVQDKALARVNARYSQQTLVWEQNEDMLRRRVRDGDASVTEPYLDAEMNAGRIGPSQRQAVEAYRQSVLRANKETSDNVALVSGAFNGGAPLDPQNGTHKKAVNDHFDTLAKEIWPAGTLPSPEVWNSAINYTKKIGMVPERVRSAIRGGLHSGRPDLALRAVETVNNLRNFNPQLVAELGDEDDMRLATMIGTYAASGMAPEQAVERANEALKVSKAERDVRTADYDLQRGKEPKDRATSDEKWIAAQQNSLWINDPVIDPLMRTEFSEIAKAEYTRTGNLEASRRMALDTVNRVWGRSEVGGEQRYVKQAPEKFYSVPNLTPAENSTWMNEQLLGDVSKGALQDPTNPITADRLRLIPDSTRTNDGNPVYRVWLVQPNKGWEQVVDTKGEPIRWFPNYSISADRQRRDAVAAAELERAKRLRQEQGEREQSVPDRNEGTSNAVR
jgi:hypothetical protein